MKTLALEFSSERRSVALMLAGEAKPLAQAEEVGLKSTKAFTLIDQVLNQAGWEREDVECIVVGLGPGSYTGIRAAIALAQGWQLGAQVKTVGMSSADALAQRVWLDGLRGKISVVIDAQRKENYLGDYELDDAGWRSLRPLRIVGAEEVAASEAGGCQIVGRDAARLIPSAVDLCPDAASLGALVNSETRFVPGEELEPIYLREVAFVKAPPPREIPDIPV